MALTSEVIGVWPQLWGFQKPRDSHVQPQGKPPTRVGNGNSAAALSLEEKPCVGLRMEQPPSASGARTGGTRTGSGPRLWWLILCRLDWITRCPDEAFFLGILGLL